MKTIILIHGLRGTHHGLNQIAAELSHKYKVINPDLPGSGTRVELENQTLDGMIEWLHTYIEGLHLKQKPYIIGHSMGSMIVSHYLEKYPNQTQKKTVLISPIFRTNFNQKISNFIFCILNLFLHFLPTKIRHKVLGSKFVSFCISHYLTYDKTQQKRIDQLHYKYSGRFASAKSIIADIKTSMNHQTIIPSQKNTLMIVGDKDKMTSINLVRQNAQKPFVSTEIVPETGHLINYECPAVVAQKITSFLK